MSRIGVSDLSLARYDDSIPSRKSIKLSRLFSFFSFFFARNVTTHAVFHICFHIDHRCCMIGSNWEIITRVCTPRRTRTSVFLMYPYAPVPCPYERDDFQPSYHPKSSFKHCPDNLRRSVLFLLRGRAHVEPTKIIPWPNQSVTVT